MDAGRGGAPASLPGLPLSYAEEAVPGQAEVPSGEAAPVVAEAPACAAAAEAPECPGEVVCCPAEVLPAGPEAAPVLVKTPAYAVELPPCHGVPGPSLGEIPATEQEAIPIGPREPPREFPIRGKCLLHNWQEERATDVLDRVPSPDQGSEGFFYRHGHRGLLSLQFLAGLSGSTTMKDSYRRPCRTGLPVRGQREAMMEWLLYQKHRKEVLEEEVYPPPKPMESQSTTQQDYHREGFLSVPPAPAKPHNYRLEQPQTFWLEHAQQVPGISNIRTGDTPFKKCATFTTPITEYLDQPLPYGPENYPKL